MEGKETGTVYTPGPDIKIGRRIRMASKMSAFLRRVSRPKEKSEAELTVPEEIVKYCGGIRAPPNSFESMSDSGLDGTQAPKNSLENDDDDISSPPESDSVESPYTASLGKGEDLVTSQEPDKFSFRGDAAHPRRHSHIGFICTCLCLLFGVILLISALFINIFNPYAF